MESHEWNHMFSTGGYFPDSVSSRASRHVKELETLVKDGAQWLSSASVEWVGFSWFYFATEEGHWWYINTKNPAKPWNLLLVWQEKVPWSLWSKEGTCAAMFALLHITTPNLLKLVASCPRFGFFISHVCSRFLDKRLSWWTNIENSEVNENTLLAWATSFITDCSSKPWTSFKEIDARFLRRLEISDRMCGFRFCPYHISFFSVSFFPLVCIRIRNSEKNKKQKNKEGWQWSPAFWLLGEHIPNILVRTFPNFYMEASNAGVYRTLLSFQIPCKTSVSMRKSVPLHLSCLDGFILW